MTAKLHGLVTSISYPDSEIVNKLILREEAYADANSQDNSSDKIENKVLDSQFTINQLTQQL